MSKLKTAAGVEVTGPITANGTYYLDVPGGDEVVFDVDGTFGGRTVTLVYESVTGQAREIKDDAGDALAYTGFFVKRVMAGSSGRVGFTVSGAGDAPSLRAGWVNVSRRPGPDNVGSVPAGS